MSKPSAEYVRSLLDYCPESGVFTWRVTRGRMAKVGFVAGSDNGLGYLRIQIDGKSHMAHRLAWLHQTGEWPVEQIDHRNGVKTDNRFVNLREASGFENAKNRKKGRDNTSGFKGVCWHKATGKWAASITSDGVKYHLNLYDTPEQANAAREFMESLCFGQFTRITVTTTTTVFER